MRTPLVFLLLLFVCGLSAQITLTQANVPAPGDTLFYARDTLASSFEVGTAGPDQFWDFSGLVPEETFELIATDAAEDPNATLYEGANLIITTEGLTTYLERTDTAVYLLGGGLPEAAQFGLDGIVFGVPQKLYQFPSTYETSFAAYYEVDATVDGSIFISGVDSIRYIRRSSASVEIDAFGTLKTPYNNYDVLRQRTASVNADSIYVFYFGNWVPFTADTSYLLEYQWLAAETKGSVVTAIVDEETGQVEQIEFFLDVENANAPLAGFTFEDMGAGTVEFTDQSGNNPTAWQWTFGDGNTSTEQNPSHLYATSGDYQVCLTVENNVGTDQTCQQVSIELPNGLPEPEHRIGIRVYPNPTDRYLQVAPIDQPPYSYQLTLFDLQGKQIRQVRFQDHIRLDLLELPAGLYGYFLRTEDGKKWSSGKVQVR